MVALARKADALRMLDRNEEALECAEEATRLGGQLGGEERVRALAVALRVEADVLRMLDRNSEALAAAEKAVRYAAQVGDVRAEVDALRPVAFVLLRYDRNEESLVACERAAALAHEAGYALGEANALDAAADTLLKLERNEESLVAAARAAELYRQVGDRLRGGQRNPVYHQRPCGRSADRGGRGAGAGGDGAIPKVGDRLGEGNALRAMSDALHKLGRDEERCSAPSTPTSGTSSAAAGRGRADALRAQSRTPSAAWDARKRRWRAPEEAEAIFRQSGSRQGQAECLLAKATAARAWGRRRRPGGGPDGAGAIRANRHEGHGPVRRVCGAGRGGAGLGAGGSRAVARLHAEFGTQLGEILESAERTEEAWHRELRRPRHEPCAPGTGELLILRQWPSYATLSLAAVPG